MASPLTALPGLLSWESSQRSGGVRSTDSIIGTSYVIAWESAASDVGQTARRAARGGQEEHQENSFMLISFVRRKLREMLRQPCSEPLVGEKAAVAHTSPSLSCPGRERASRPPAPGPPRLAGG